MPYMYTTVVCGMAFLPLPTFSSWKKMFPKATMWLTDVFIRFGHIQKRAASKQEVLMIKFMVLLSFVYNSIEKDHIKIALPLLYCTYFAGLLLFRQSTKSNRVTAGNTGQTWASFFLYRISTKLAGVKMTQDPPFQYC